MSDLQPYVIELVQGATLFRELSILEEDREPVDVSATAKTIQVSDGISETDFSITQGTENHFIEMRSDGANTLTWPVGSFSFRIWLDWGGNANIEDEPIFSGSIVVRPAL